MVAASFFQPRASFAQRTRTPVFAVPFQQVVRHEDIGVFCKIAAESFLRPMRVCIAANGSGRSSAKASASPSSTVPSGITDWSASNSGKRSVTNSSPRDQIVNSPRRCRSCARMPSHFHSACQS